MLLNWHLKEREHVIYRVFPNLICTLFTVSAGLKIRFGLKSRADYIRGQEMDLEKMMEPLYVP
jgi:hypothetical protein